MLLLGGINLKKTNILLRCILVVIILFSSFIILHITPALAVRSHLFVTGHPVAPFTVNVSFNKPQQNMDKDLLERENCKIYCIDGDITDNDIGTLIHNFKVKKIGFLYFADYYGEA